jgi:pyridoxine 4-dehydrogenase
VTAAQLAEARAIAPVVCVQNRYGVGAPAAEQAFLRSCGDSGVAYVPYFAIAGDGPGRPEREDVLAVARARGVSAAQVRLAWTLQQGPHVLAIPGTGNPDHLEANVAAGTLRLAPEELARLNG